MKYTTVIIIVIYLAAFAVGGYFFYKKYFNQVITPPEKNETVAYAPDKSIYYTSDNSLYQLNSDMNSKTITDASNYRLQETGKVESVLINKSANTLIHSVLTPTNNNEIWQMNLKDNSAEKLFSPQTPGLEKYTNFRNPRLSEDEKYLAFLADLENLSQIFVWQNDTKTLDNLSHSSFSGTISSLTWDKNKNLVYFVGTTSESKDNALYSLDLSKTLKTLWEGPQTLSSINAMLNKIIFLFKDKDTINLGYFTVSDFSKIAPVTDLVSPKKVINFNLSQDEKRLTYQVQDTSGKTNDIYTMNTDGTNLLQITTNGKSAFPMMSPDGNNIAFWEQNNGIYTIKIDKKDKNKLLNSTALIDKIILWK